jgi:hypothetical protein
MPRVLGPALALLALAPSVLSGQQQPPPPMVAVSYYQCTAAPPDLEAIYSTWERVFSELQQEGKVTGWGVLTHAWADEWNVIFYRNVRDLSQLQESQQAQGPKTQAIDPDFNRKLAAACPHHKDNIYWVMRPRPTG